MKLNKAKRVFSAREITFLGQTLTGDGIKPDHRNCNYRNAKPSEQGRFKKILRNG